MESGQDKMAGLGGLHGGVNAFAVTDFTDENDIGILAHGVADAVGEGIGIDAHFALLELAEIILENVFDGIFDSYDPEGGCFVDLLDERADGGAFALTGWAGE